MRFFASCAPAFAATSHMLAFISFINILDALSLQDAGLYLFCLNKISSACCTVVFTCFAAYEFDSLNDIGWYGAVYQLGRHVNSAFGGTMSECETDMLAAPSFSHLQERYI